jgi:hypothetical protein
VASQNNTKELSPEHYTELCMLLRRRFEKNMHRHSELHWDDIQKKLDDAGSKIKLRSLYEMEKTGGEPDVVGFDIDTREIIFCDCSPESPSGRRSLCYDREALESRKENKPLNSVLDMARELGIELLTEKQYRALQQLGHFDTKTSSWIQTPADIRKSGGALFADFRYGHVFIYHNGAQSYYAARGFRGSLRI